MTASASLHKRNFHRGGVAQLGERLNGIQEAVSSILSTSTRNFKGLQRNACKPFLLVLILYYSCTTFSNYIAGCFGADSIAGAANQPHPRRSLFTDQPSSLGARQPIFLRFPCRGSTAHRATWSTAIFHRLFFSHRTSACPSALPPGSQDS